VQRRRGALRPDTLQPITLPLTAPLLERLYPGLVWGQAQYFLISIRVEFSARTRIVDPDPVGPVSFCQIRIRIQSLPIRIRDRIQPGFFLIHATFYILNCQTCSFFK
jgi:hypothetical protein